MSQLPRAGSILGRPTPQQLLRWSIDRSRHTIRRYAAKLFRSERTVSRWLDGETHLPRSILNHLIAEWEQAGSPKISPEILKQDFTPPTD